MDYENAVPQEQNRIDLPPDEGDMAAEAENISENDIKAEAGSVPGTDMRAYISGIKAAIEAILFTMGDSQDLQSISDALGMTSEDLKPVLDEMIAEYDMPDNARGIHIVRLEDRYQLATKKDYYPVLIRLASQPRKISLSDVVMETLSIIAYKQPVTRIEIEKIRGVKCDHAVNRLLEYNLIQEVGRLDAPGRPILFGTTEEFLRHFGTGSLDDLPAINPVKVEDFRAEAEEEAGVKLGI